MEVIEKVIHININPAESLPTVSKNLQRFHICATIFSFLKSIVTPIKIENNPKP